MSLKKNSVSIMNESFPCKDPRHWLILLLSENPNPNPNPNVSVLSFLLNHPRNSRDTTSVRTCWGLCGCRKWIYSCRSASLAAVKKNK